MKQNKTEMMIIYECTRDSIAKTNPEFRRFSYINPQHTIFDRLYNKELEYCYSHIINKFITQIPEPNDNIDVFVGKCVAYRLEYKDKVNMDNANFGKTEMYNWLSKQIGQNVIAAYRADGKLLSCRDMENRRKCCMNLTLVVADGFEYLPTAKHKESALDSANKLVVYENLCLKSIEDTFRSFDLIHPRCGLNNDNNITIEFDDRVGFSNELERVINQKRDEIFALLYDGKLKKAMDDAGLELDFKFTAFCHPAFKVKE